MRSTLTAVILCICAAGWAQTITVSQPLATDKVASEPNLWAQAIADALRIQTKADAAFIAAGFFADARIEAGSAPTETIKRALQYPDDEVVILTLRGDQLKAAFERALSLAPQRNSAFLQVSGIRVEYTPKGGADSRVTAVFVGDKPLVADREYRVATTAPLGRGALGYFRIWDKAQVTKNTQLTIDAVISSYLAGKTVLPLDPKVRIVAKE